MYLMQLKNACNMGMVSLTKKEWDELDFHDGIFLMEHETLIREKSKTPSKGKQTFVKW